MREREALAHERLAAVDDDDGHARQVRARDAGAELQQDDVRAGALDRVEHVGRRAVAMPERGARLARPLRAAVGPLARHGPSDRIRLFAMGRGVFDPRPLG